MGCGDGVFEVVYRGGVSGWGVVRCCATDFVWCGFVLCGVGWDGAVLCSGSSVMVVVW